MAILNIGWVYENGIGKPYLIINDNGLALNEGQQYLFQGIALDHQLEIKNKWFSVLGICQSVGEIFLTEIAKNDPDLNFLNLDLSRGKPWKENENWFVSDGDKLAKHFFNPEGAYNV